MRASVVTADRIATLERIWHREIPISAAMGIRIVRFANDVLEARAALAPNVNVHGTAFAGSLYAIAALTGWGSVWLALQARGLDGHIVIAEGSIQYLKPVGAEIVARCRFATEDQAHAWQTLGETGKCRFPLDVAVAVAGADEDAARFRGSYAVRAIGNATRQI